MPASSSDREAGCAGADRDARPAAAEAAEPEVWPLVKPMSPEPSERIIRFAFDYARAQGRSAVHCVTKANIMKHTDGLFLEVFRHVAAEYADIEPKENLVDAICMGLVQRPEEYDVLVLPNLYSDIVSDLAAGLVGGLEVRRGANIGADAAVARGDARLCAEIPRPEQGQPDRDDPLGQAHARPPGRARRRAAGERGRGRNRRRPSLTYDMKPTRDDPTAVGTSEVADAIIDKLELLVA